MVSMSGGDALVSQDVPPNSLTKLAAGLVRHDTKPRLIIDAECHIHWASGSARACLRRPLPVYIDEDRLAFEEESGLKSCRSFFDAISEERERIFVRGSSELAWLVIAGWSESVGDNRLLFLEFSLYSPVACSLNSGMREQFGLTLTECTVIDRLGSLCTPTQIARDLGVAIQTVRTHVKRIHAKLGVSSQSQLLQITRAFCDG